MASCSTVGMHEGGGRGDRAEPKQVHKPDATAHLHVLYETIRSARSSVRSGEVPSASRAPIDAPAGPYLTAAASRYACWTIIGRLELDPLSMQSHLSRCGPVGDQLLGRMNKLQSNGWTFSPLKFNDPLLTQAHPNYFKRLGAYLSMGGYNSSSLRRITYGSPLSTLCALSGALPGRSNPSKEYATFLAHELSHADGILVGDSLKNHGERRVFADRMLATETRALLAELHVADKIGASILDHNRLRASAMARDLGGGIFDNCRYKQFAAINRADAVRFVNRYTDETFGASIFDSQTGKVRTFDINAGLDRQIGKTSQDEFLRQLRQIPGEPIAGARTCASRMSFNNRSARVLGYCGRSLFALGSLGTLADVAGAFKQSPAHGVGRLARTGLDWGGFEISSVLARRAGTIAACLLKSPVLARVVPLISLAGTLVGTEGVDRFIATRVESVISRQTPPSRSRP